MKKVKNFKRDSAARGGKIFDRGAPLPDDVLRGDATSHINNLYSRYATHCIATIDVLTMYFDEDSEYVTIPKRLLEVPLFFGRRLARHLSPSEVAEIRSFREKMINNFNLEALRSELMADGGKMKISAIDYGY